MTDVCAKVASVA